MTAPRPSIALVSREIAPLVGGGIAPVVRAAGELLAGQGWDVTFVTDARYHQRFTDLQAAGDPDAQTRARWVWIEAGDDYGDFTCWPHLWSARVDAGLRRAFPEHAPDLIEFSDYIAEGFVTLQRRATSDPWLDGTTVAVRVHTSSEMCSVLNGAISDQRPDLALFEMERYCLTAADRLIAQGGDIADTYRRFYSDVPLAPFVQIRYALPGVAMHQQEAFDSYRTQAREQVRGGDQHLHLLFLGRTERRKGIVELAEALCRRPDLNVSLDIVGGDTETGPLGSSVREHLELLAASDDRITMRGQVDPWQVPTLIGAADAVIAPSRWECWPNVAFESLLIGRPVLATPVGGLREIVADGVNGMLADGTDARALEALLERAFTHRGELRAMSNTAAFASHLATLTDLTGIVEGYEALVGVRPRNPDALLHADRRVAVVVPYFKLDQTIQATLASLAAQSHRELEVLIVNDGSLRDDDAALFRLADQYGARVLTMPNGGLSAARNFGLRATTAPYVCMLDADDELDPRFISRSLAALEADPQLAYVTSWVRYIDDNSEPWPDPDDVRGYFPFGNWTSMMSFTNLAGVCTSVIRRSALREAGDLEYDQRLASYEDWDLYRQLAEAGRYGAVIPERWFHYRVRADSMTRQDAQPNLERLVSELRAAARFRTVDWTPQLA